VKPLSLSMPVFGSDVFCVNPIYYGDDVASSLVSDVGRYVIIIKLLDTILNVLPLLKRRREIQTYLHRDFSSVRHDVRWYIEQMGCMAPGPVPTGPD
jgi:hypothetical protein